jgi:hypothetical protein
MQEKKSKHEKVSLGPYLSVSIPIIMRAGMVSATFKINKVLISLAFKPRLLAITPSKGAWLNHTKKVIKNAIQLKCNTFILPTNEKSLIPTDELMMLSKNININRV